MELVRADGQDQEGIELTRERRCYAVVETTTNTTSHPDERNGQVPDGMEADQQQADEEQNDGEARQHHHHPVLYTPTKDREKEEESKHALYDQLQTKQQRAPRHEIKIVMGDVKAKVGNDDTNHG